MKVFVFVFVCLFFTGIVSSLEADLECPSEVNIDEEFKCSFSFDEDLSSYDIKFDISREGSSVAKIFDVDKNEFKSAYYYVKDFSGDEISLKIEDIGEFDSIFKVRVGSKVTEFPFEITAIADSLAETAKDLNEETIVDVEETRVEEIILDEVSSPRETIALNSLNLVKPEIVENMDSLEVVYESKEFRNYRFLYYAFLFFLIVVICFLLWEKF